MKKAVLLIAVIAVVSVLSLSLAACNNATVQGQLENVWRPYEKYVYKVTDVDGTVGSYSVVIEEHLKGETVVCGASTLNDVKNGYLVTGELNIGSTKFDTACYFNLIDSSSYLVPVASYRKQTVDSSTTLEINATYDGAKYNYSGSINGEAKSGVIEAKAPFYDNNEFHQVLRGASSMATSFSFNYNVPVVSENEAGVFALTASVSATEDVTVPVKDSAINCYKLNVSRSTKVAGASQTLYYSTEALAVDSNLDGVVDAKDWKLTRALVKIVEPAKGGNVVYELQTATTNKPIAA